MLRRRSGIGSAVIGVIIIILLMVAGVAAYAVLKAPNSSTTTSTSSGSSTTAISSVPSTTTSSETTTTSSPSTTSSTSTTSASYVTTFTNSSSTSCSLSLLGNSSIATTTTTSSSDITDNLTATENLAPLLPLLDAYSAMTLQQNVTESLSGPSLQSSMNESVTDSYSTVYVSPTTYKITFSIDEFGLSSSGTAWILNNGTVLAVETGGSNSTGFMAQTAQLELSLALASFGSVTSAADIGSYSGVVPFHPTGTSTISIGATPVAVTTYAANSLPQTLVGVCGFSTTITAFSFSEGTPHGESAPIVVYSNVAVTTSGEGENLALDSTLQITSLTVAPNSTTSSSTTTSSPWLLGASYPLEASSGAGVEGESCVNGTAATIVCVGGFGNGGEVVNNVYSATVSSSGSVNGWTADASYPKAVAGQSCVSYQGYAYCVGGISNDESGDVASSYFAPLTSAGTGTWQQTTSYPVPVDSQSCVASTGYIYCVGGENETDGTNATLVQTNSDWYAQLTSSGIGAWKHTTAYPQGVTFPTCAASSTDVYCVGGFDPNGNGLDSVYYSPLSSSGIGQWSSTTGYGATGAVGSCAIDSGSIICDGGLPVLTDPTASDAIYSAPISASGVGHWSQAANYPTATLASCVVVSGNLYCVGGYAGPDNNWSDLVYYAPVRQLLG